MNFREQLDTPALVVHDEILQKNLTEMADYANAQGIALRPHFKTHKTAAVAQMQKRPRRGRHHLRQAGRSRSVGRRRRLR